MTSLKIKNKKDFVSNFLGPVSNLNDMCVLTLYKDKIECTIAGADSTIVCKAATEIESDITDSRTLNIPDIRKLVRVLEIIPEQDIEIKINENNIAYNKNGYRFKFHLLDDGFVKLPNINVEKVNELEFGTTFKVSESNLTTLFKGSAFTTETSKLYVYSDGGTIAGELGDRSRHNTDNFVCTVSDTFDGKEMSKPLPVNFESFRLISFSQSREIDFRINEELGIITCSLRKGNVALTYVVSALIN
tara:strand:- start:117 stop:854 length:738 start_codon:yes stop_codon:yes gene_type:complete